MHIEGGTIQGYCILVTQQGLKLVQINKVGLDNFRNGSWPQVQQAGRLLATVGIGDVYAKHSFKIVVDPTSISVWANGNLVIDNYILPVEHPFYGFGPITSHARHACSQHSFFTFSDIRMETQQSYTLPEALNQYGWIGSGARALLHVSDGDAADLGAVRE